MTKEAFLDFVDHIDTDKIFERYDAKLAPGKPVALYGSGAVGRDSRRFLTANGYEVAYFVDSDARKHGSRVDGVEVIAPERLRGLQNDATILISAGRCDEIAASLRSMGVMNFFVFNHWTLEFRKYLSSQGETLREALRWLAGTVAGGASLDVIFRAFSYFLYLEYDAAWVEANLDGAQYFTPGIVNLGGGGGGVPRGLRRLRRRHAAGFHHARGQRF